MEQVFAAVSVRETMEDIASLTVTLRRLVRSLADAVASAPEAARGLQVMESLAQVAGYGQFIAAGAAKKAQVEQLGERGMAASRDNGDATQDGEGHGAGDPAPGDQGGTDGWAVPGVPGPDTDGHDAAGNAWIGGAVYTDTAAFMADALLITAREARDRLAIAASVLQRPGISGPPLPPQCPTVAAALAEGRLGTATAGRIVRAVRKAAPAALRIDGGGELLAVMEETTTVLAATATPAEVSQILAAWLERFDEDTEPDERTRRQFEGVFDRGTRHGLREFLLRCRPEDAETLRTVMNLFTNPRTGSGQEARSENGGGEAADTAAPAGEEARADTVAMGGADADVDADVDGGNRGADAQGGTGDWTVPGSDPWGASGADVRSGAEADNGSGKGESGDWTVPAGDPWDASASDAGADAAGDAGGVGAAQRPGEVDGTGGSDWSSWAVGAGTDDEAEENGGRGTRAQQMLHGLLAALRAALAGGGMPQSGGLRPQLMVHIDYDSLTGTDTCIGIGAGSGAGPDSGQPPGYPGGLGSPTARSSKSRPPKPHGGSGTYERRMPAAEARRLACEADILPVVLAGTGEILDLGRAQRLFTAAQRKALAARDRGCAFPGCGIPSAWAEAHHIVPWQGGGGTDIGNGVLLCGHHHRVIHRNCWSIEVRDGIPWFLPPDYLDPERGPRRNLHHHPELAFEPMLPAVP